MKFLNKEKLNQLNTTRLLAHLKVVNIRISNIANYCGTRCCKVCNDYIGSNWEQEVGIYLKPVEEYKILVKNILNTRKHIIRKIKKPTNKRIKFYRRCDR